MSQSSLFKNIAIIHETDDFVVFNKPYGLVVNKSETSPQGTLQDYLLEMYNFPEMSEDSSEFVNRSGIVHRLDKDTSGLILVAKNEQYFNFFQKQFAQRMVKKEYLAITYGKLPQELIRVDAPIGRSSKNRMKFAVSKDGKNAVTVFNLLGEVEYFGKILSVVKCSPVTGRTHQIRVHLCALNCPVIGDKVYSGRKQYAWATKEAGFTRMMLHAYKLGISTVDGSELSWFESPPDSAFTKLPLDFSL